MNEKSITFDWGALCAHIPVHDLAWPQSWLSLSPWIAEVCAEENAVSPAVRGIVCDDPAVRYLWANGHGVAFVDSAGGFIGAWPSPGTDITPERLRHAFAAMREVVQGEERAERERNGGEHG